MIPENAVKLMVKNVLGAVMAITHNQRVSWLMQ